MELEKEEQKKKLLDVKKTLKTAHDLPVAETLKVYELFCCSVFVKVQMQGDKIVKEMHSKDPWIGVSG
jgi:hypothetical protein